MTNWKLLLQAFGVQAAYDGIEMVLHPHATASGRK